MKRLGMLCLVSLLGTVAFGQRHGGAVSGGRAPGGSAAWVHVHSPGLSLRHDGFRQTTRYPYAFPIFDGGYGYEYPAQPTVIFVPQPAPQVIAPPREVRSEIREYSLPAEGTPAASERGETPAFAIALADGARLSASAVWVQDGSLHYVDRQHQHHQVPLSSVDRQLTRQLNQERNLNFWLPAT
jgi:hypothetical protein